MAINIAVVSAAGQPLMTPMGVSTNRMANATSWIQKQPRPGPRSASSGAPL